MKRIMYHITNRKNLPSILKEGLIPKRPSYGFPKELDWKFETGVYLTSEKPIHGDSEITVTLRVNIHGLLLKKDKDPDLENSYYVEETIKPERIKLTARTG